MQKAQLSNIIEKKKIFANIYFNKSGRMCTILYNFKPFPLKNKKPACSHIISNGIIESFRSGIFVSVTYKNC